LKLPVEEFKGLKIVVVEDYDDARKYISIYLRQLGASVIEARNGIEGLEAVKAHRPALVLADILMPESDGFEMLRDIRALGNDGNIPVIAMTAQVNSELTLAAGFDAFLPKPFTPNDLFWTIRSVLRHSAVRLGGVVTYYGRNR
jgi:CheY-like chemotaxis protein